MSIEIKVPFPKYEGMEVKKVTADIEKGYSVVEYGEKSFKDGDVLYLLSDSGQEWLLRYSHTEGIRIYYHYNLYLDNKSIFYNDYAEYPFLKVRHADQSEVKILEEYLSSLGKKWNDGTKQVEPIEKDILVPESIGIYKLKAQFMSDLDNGDRLYIGFNDTQVLGYADGKYRSDVRCPKYEYHDWYEKVQCKLTPCKREELKEGDTAFWTYESGIKPEELIDITSYCKIIDNKDAIYIEHNLTCVCSDDEEIFWYKVGPIQ